MNKAPHHISFVLDGNRRWARSQNLPVWQGHTVALDKVIDFVEWSIGAGVGYVTLYVFSTENWGRSEEELSKLLGEVAMKAISQKFPRLLEMGAKVNVWGSLERFAAPIQKGLQKLMDDSVGNTTIVVNLCMDYGGRAELVRAVQQIVDDGITKVDEAAIEQRLFSAGMPDPDLMIRTGGAQRLSNYLLWQHSYSELYFTEKFLPEFEKEDFDAALEWYADQERRLGK